MRHARHCSREIAMQTLYQWLITETSLPDIIDFMKSQPGFKQVDTEFYEILISGIKSNIENLNHILAVGLDRPLSKLSTVEHAILLIGAYELDNCKDTPFRVVINEAIKLTKTFGAPDGFRFVNGVLDKVASKLREEEIAGLNKV